MLVSMIKENKLVNTTLPNRVYGSFWITDYDENNNEYNLINIEAYNNQWKINSNDDYIVKYNNNLVSSIILNNYTFYCIKNVIRNIDIYIYCSPENDPTNSFIEIKAIPKLTIGKENNNIITYNRASINENHAELIFENNMYNIKDLNSQNGVFVNNERISGTKTLEFGDIIFIMGLKIIVMLDKQVPYLIINNPLNLVQFHSSLITQKTVFKKNIDPKYLEEADLSLNLYDSKDYYYNSPRFKSNIDSVKIVIDAPPEEEKLDQTPFIYIIGPMLTMGMTSCTTALVTLNSVMNEGRDIKSAIPSLVICGAMLASMILWPLLNKKYQNKQKKKREQLRQTKYSNYIESKRKDIIKEVENQTNIAKNNHVSLKECESIILNKKRNLWDKRYGEEDFLTVSLGQGNLAANIDIQYPEEHFSMNDDNLKEMVYSLGNEPKELQNVPIMTSFFEINATAIIGNFNEIKMFMDGIFLQLMTFYSYDEIKILMITSKNHEKEWDYLKVLPHCFNDERTLRYFSVNSDETKELMYYIEKVFQERTDKEAKNNKIKKHYLIVTDNFKLLRSFDIIKKILALEENIGISFIIMNQDLSSVPSECKHIINISQNNSFMIEKILNSNNNVKFKLDLNPYINMYTCAEKLLNIPIEIDSSSSNNLPIKYDFLEMYDVGKIEQLNILNRWEKNSPILSLQAPIGIETSGDIMKLDLHEKYHGPHGLIAGMTGSGKSEFIITYILSMAVNYHPDEVQFILIDYKGGGLAGAFENKENNIRLPHLSGTITNLDANEIKRSLLSIESELKRRQRIFNEARRKSNDSTIDIYKYQQLYRNAKVEEPISHLFIICDEFAELKTQQSEFMQQLISTARVGRSLGVHLILATQKPSGVVDPQIWSNSRFRICLKVQEKSDSTEVIKCPDAAFLKQTGRFYLQVGYNEIFQLGQAAWAGGNYIPSEKFKTEVNTSLNFINNIGNIIKEVDNNVKQNVTNSKGEELSNLVKYLSELAFQQHIQIRRLWLDRISEFIYLDDLKTKYRNQDEKFILDPIIGEYDLPARQQQKELRMSLSKDGNAIIYGSAGSGKENFITTFIYSLMQSKRAEDVNIYVLDFGSETLKIFEESSIVGDIIFSDDTEKVCNLYKMLSQEVEMRKKKFQEYNGEYYSYCKNSGKTVPNIVVIINNYEVYDELYNVYEDELLQLTRDGSKYGIYFIITVSTANGLKLRIKQNINQEFVLQQNNENDYSSILGNVKKQYPSKIFGRGIIKLDDIYEFQTALVTEKDQISSFIKQKCLDYNSTDKAKKIPVLPEIVTRENIENEIEEDNIIIGIEKNTLELSKFDIKKSMTSIVSMQDIALLDNFIDAFLEQISVEHNTNLYVLNVEDIKIDNDICNVYNSKFNEFIVSLYNMIMKQYELYSSLKEENNFRNMKSIVIVIIGLGNFMEKLTDENKLKFQEIFEKGKNLNLYYFVIIDSIDKLKKVELETWFRSTVNNNTGIWLGSGIADQYTIKLTKSPKELREEIPNNFCYVISRGIAHLVQYVERFK